MANPNLFLILFIFIFMLSCQPQDNAYKDNEIAKESVQDLIDAEQYDEAIQKINDNKKYQEKNNFVDAEWSMLLATAYAGKAGLKVEKIWGFTLGYENPYFKIESTDYKASLKKYERLTGPLGKRTQKDWVVDFLSALATYDAFLQRWNSIPTVNDSQIRYLQVGIQQLQSSEKPAFRLYSALLRLVILKSALLSGLEKWDLWQSNFLQNENLLTNDYDQVVQKHLCQYTQWLWDLIQDTEFILQDLKISYPSKISELEKLSSDLKSSQLQGQSLCQK